MGSKKKASMAKSKDGMDMMQGHRKLGKMEQPVTKSPESKTYNMEMKEKPGKMRAKKGSY